MLRSALPMVILSFMGENNRPIITDGFGLRPLRRSARRSVRFMA